jgi:hypothetical protein
MVMFWPAVCAWPLDQRVEASPSMASGASAAALVAVAV